MIDGIYVVVGGGDGIDFEQAAGDDFVEQERELLGIARAHQHALAIIQDFGFDDVIEFEGGGGQLRRDPSSEPVSA